MKNKLLSFLAVLTCLCFTASPLCVGAALPLEVIEIIVETVGGYMTLVYETSDGTPSGFAGGQKEWTKQIFEKAFEQPLIDPDTGEASFILHNYDFITGKYQLHTETATYNSDWTVKEVIPNDYLVEITMCLSDIALGYYTDPNTGVTYWANGLNISITEPKNWVTGANIGGTVNHYFVEYPLNFNYSTQVTFGGSRISVASQTGCKLYRVNGGTRTVMQNSFSTGAVYFNYLTDNEITVNPNDYTTPSNTSSLTYTQYPLGIYSYVGGTITSPGLDHPVDIDICHGSFQQFYQGVKGDGTAGGTASRVFRCNEYLKCGFVTTNNPQHSATLVTNNVDNSEKNYYISTYQGGTVIDKDSEIGTKIAPVFELDPSLPDFLDDVLALIPTLLELLDGDLLGDMAGLIGALVDFFSHMPDIGTGWNSDNELNTNNYFEVDLPSYNPPDSGGGGTGDINVTVDITRPKIPAIDTSPHVTLYYPTVTTTALPANIVSAGKEFVDWGKEVTDLTGTTNIIIVCGLIGVGVMLLFKDW